MIAICRALGVASLLVVVVGCGHGYEMATVKGKVTIGGKPASSGRIVFSPNEVGEDAPMSSAERSNPRSCSPNIRRFSVFSTMWLASSSLSSELIPTRMTSPGPICPSTSPPTETDARVTRWSRARTAQSLSLLPVADASVLDSGAFALGSSFFFVSLPPLSPGGE